MTRLLWRSGKAMRSRLRMPIIGTRRAWAKALAVAMPTRMPVNRPGPMSTAMQPISLSATSACSQVNSMAGVRISAWRRLRVTSKQARTPSWPPMAHPTRRVAVSMPRISTACSSRRRAPRRPSWRPPSRRLVEYPQAADPRPPDGAQGHDALVVVRVAHGQADLEELGGQGGYDGVAPLDEGDGLAVEQLAQGQIRELLQVVEAVDVEVVQADAPFVLACQRERGARHDLVDLEAAGEALGERGLAAAEVPHEQDQVPGPHHLRDGAGQGPGLVDRAGAALQHAGVVHERVPEAAARATLARTKSARIWASGSFPPRSAAAGCSVGISTPWANG